MNDDIEKLFEGIKSDQPPISPEDKILLEEAKELFKHCEEEKDYGLSQNPLKFDLKKFLFLKNTKKVNKYLIWQLSYIAKKNILLRYLLIEAGLRNRYIEKLLKETDFYSIRNNPEDFYFDNNVPEELRFSKTMLKIKLTRYSILTPEDASYLIIGKKTEELANKLIEKFIENIKDKMQHAFRVLIYSNKYKDSHSKPTSEKLITETYEDLNNYYDNIRKHYSYWTKNLVEAEFSKKTHSIDGSFINYFNEMFWLNEEKYKVFIEGFFYFPNLLVELFDKQQKGAEIYFGAFTKYSELLDSEIKSRENQIAKLEGANETYQKALEDKQEEQRKKIDNMAESYIIACEGYKTEKPTTKELSELSGISIDIWKKQLSNSEFLFVLSKRIESKKKLSKNKISFWTGAFTHINKKFGNALQDKKVKKKSYDEDVDYYRESGKKKKSNFNSDDI